MRIRFMTPDRDRGALSVFVAICAAGFLIVIGIVLDAGGRLRAVERADALAQEAARAAGQQVDERRALAGEGFFIDKAAAEQAGYAYLAANDVGGTTAVNVDAQTGTVTVTVDSTYDTALLGVGLHVHGVGKAKLVHGVKEAENG